MSTPSLVDLIERQAALQPDLCVYRFLRDGEDDAVELRFAPLVLRARSLAAHLQARDLAGERAVLLFPPGEDFLLAFLGCLYAGVIAVPVYPPEPERLDRALPRLQAVMVDADAAVVLTTSEFLPLAEAFAAEIPALLGLGFVAVDTLGDLAADWRHPGTTGADCAVLQYTSGSTGSPRGVRVSHANLDRNSALIQRAVDHKVGESRGVIWLPPYHDLGLVCGVLHPVWGGFENTLMSPVSFVQQPARWLKAVSRYRASTSGAPNFGYELATRRIREADLEGVDLSCWRVAFVGAEPTRLATLEAFAARFAPYGFDKRAFYMGYGLAESTLVICGGWFERDATVGRFDTNLLAGGRAVHSEADDARVVVGCGRPLDGHTIAVVDPATGERRASGAVGELWVAGPCVAEGYWRGDDEAFAATLDGVRHLRTGDTGFILGGQVHITGRLKDLIIVRGRNHAAHDLEATAEAAHEAIRPGCVAAFSVEVEGEERVVIAAEVRREYPAASPLSGADPVVAAVTAALTRDHGLLVHAVALLTPGALPKTSSGKLRRSTCQEEFLAGTLRSVGVWTAPPPPPSVYRNLPEACAVIDRRKTRYQFDIDRDVAWDRAEEPGIYATDAMVGLFGVDGAAIRANPAAHDLFQWAISIALSEVFVRLESAALDFTRAEEVRLGRSRSLELFNAEEVKHVTVFRRFSQLQAARRPALAARLLAYIDEAAEESVWDMAAVDPNLPPVALHYLSWMNLLFVEEHTIVVSNLLRDVPGVQPTWLSLHEAHRREEIQHVLTDYTFIQALDLDEGARQRWSAVFLRRAAEELHRLVGYAPVFRLCREEFPELTVFDPPEALLRHRWHAERTLLKLLKHDGFDRTVRCAPSFAVFASRPDLDPANPTPTPARRSSAASEAEVGDLRAFMLQWLAANGRSAAADASFAEVGLDSLMAVEFAQVLSARVGTAVSPGVFWRHPTPTALAAELVGRAEA